MSPNLKSDQESTGDIGNIDKRIPYRLCCKTDIKVITTKPVNEKQINNSALHERERPESREVLRLTKVNSVDIIQTKAAIQDGNSIKGRSVTSLERQTTPSLYLPYLLGNKEADIPLVFNNATYKSFRTREERRCLAFAKSLQRDYKQLNDSKDKRLAPAAVIAISNPVKLHSRYNCNILHLRRQPAL